MLVIGDREEKEGTVSPRKRSGETIGSMSPEDVIRLIESDYPNLS
jgi:threonyl-tRNA synthetase